MLFHWPRQKQTLEGLNGEEVELYKIFSSRGAFFVKLGVT